MQSKFVQLIAIATLSAAGCARPVAVIPNAEAEEAKVAPAKADSTLAKVGGEHGWPMFGGTPERNLVNTVDKNVVTEWSVKEGMRKNVKWVVELGTTSYGTPVVAGGKVFVGTNNEVPRNPKIKGDKGVLMCFEAASGKFLWQAVHDKLPNTQENDWPKQGVASSPVVEGNRLWYVSNRCEVICADTEGLGDGKNEGVTDEQHKGDTDADIIWRLDMMKDLGVFPRYLSICSPLIAADLLFVVTANGVDEKNQLPAPKAPSFIAIDKKTGKVRWQDNSPGDKIMDGQWSNPSYAVVNGKPQVIFPGGDGWLRAFEPDTGKPIWKFDCNPKKSEYKPLGRGNRGYFLATPVVHDNKVYVGVGSNPEDGPGVGHLWCVDITKTGDLSPVNDNFDPKAAVNKESGLVWHYGGMIEPKPEMGRDYRFGRTLSTCAVYDGLVYIAELDGFLHCLDAATGKKYWEHDFKAEAWGSATFVDGKVYMGTGDGDVLVFAHGKDKKLLATNEMDKPLKSPPVVAGGVMYVLTDTHLWAIAAGK